MYDSMKEFHELQIKFENDSIKSNKKRIRWQYFLLVLHAILSLIYGIKMFMDFSAEKSVTISIICFVLWSLCIVFDIFTIKKIKKSIHNCEMNKLNSLKEIDPKTWKQEMRIKKLSRITN